MPSLTAELRHNSPLSRRILQAVSDRVKSSRTAYSDLHTKWRRNEEQAVAYLHESELDITRRLERDYTGEPTLTKVKVPYSYGVLMASHTYWTNVFLSRSPINQFTGRHGESQQQIQALEALIDYQAQVGEMLVPWYLWLLDAGKYGLGVIGVDWVDEYSIVAEIVEEPVMFAGIINTGKKKKNKVARRVEGYSGNRLTNIRPFDFYPDPRVPVRFFQKGEFCAARVEIGWNTILKRVEKGYYIAENVNMIRAKQHYVTGGVGGVEGEDRVEGSVTVQLPQPEAFYIDNETSDKSPRNAVIGAIECTIELVPKEWGLGSRSYPEKWVFTVTDDYFIVLGAQPLGANHDKFPFNVLEYEPEGYSIGSRGIPEVLKPIGDTMDWLLNSHLYSVRKALNDQFVVDPSRIELSDLENPLPGGAIRLSPGAYGSDAREALNQLQVADVTRTHLTDMGAMLNIGQRAVGVNDQLQGLINQTGRRSATEVRTGTGFGINRLKTTSEFFSAMGWTPMASMLVQNSQQYFSTERKFRIVGQLAAEAGAQFIDVSPESILGFFDFVPVDGTQPIDRIAQANLWQQIFGQITTVPQISAGYDIGRIFEWIAQLAGLKNISQFRIELTPDQQLAQLAQQGNVIPIGGAGRNAGNASVSPASSPASTGPPPPLNTTGGGPRPETGS